MANFFLHNWSKRSNLSARKNKVYHPFALFVNERCIDGNALSLSEIDRKEMRNFLLSNKMIIVIRVTKQEAIVEGLNFI